MEHRRSAIVLLVITVMAIMGFFVYAWIKGLPLTAKVNVEAVPTGLTIKIDGNSAKNGTNRVRPGKYEITASMAGFASEHQIVTVGKGQNQFVGFILNSNSASTADWYNQHPGDQQKSQDISSKLSDAGSQQLTAHNPIVNILPFIDEQTGFRIDYGISKLHPGDSSAVAIYITTDGSEGTKQAALNWLKFNGYDPANLEIIYKTF